MPDRLDRYKVVIQNVVLITLAFLMFGVAHSGLAGLEPKRRLQALFSERLVEGWYRIVYNILSVVTISPVLAMVAMLPDQVLYRLDMPWALVMRAVQAAGALGLVGALFFTDVFRFAGIAQVIAYFSGRPLPLPPEPLQEKGMYALVRHPLYFFSLLAIWPMPTMTLNTLLFNLGATAYFIIGSRVEERRLERIHGEAYRAYRQRVPWLIPWPFFR